MITKGGARQRAAAPRRSFVAPRAVAALRHHAETQLRQVLSVKKFSNGTPWASVAGELGEV
ncbi:MAG: hypothetical protein Q7J75_01640 [Rhodoferax sp.]|nr:hypothetical protein [Rhodoferax sp.]